MMFRWSRFQTLSRGFVSLRDACTLCLCKFPSASTPGFAECTFVSRPCLCRLVGRLVVELVGPPTAFPVRAPVYRGCSACTHLCATESRVTLWQRANPLLCVVGVVTSCVPCARSRGRTSRSCATEILSVCWIVLEPFGFVVGLPRLVGTLGCPQHTRHSRLHRNLQLFSVFLMVSLNSPSSGSIE